MIHLRRLAQEQGLTFDKKRSLVYGQYQGYWVVIGYNAKEKNNWLLMNVKPKDNGDGSAINAALSTLSAETKPVKFATYEDRSLAVKLNLPVRDRNDQQFLEILGEVIRICNTYSFVSCCADCGTENDLGVYAVFNTYRVLCPACFEREKAALSEKQEEIRQKATNIPAGLVGAVLGSLLGAIVWIIAYQFNYLVGIAGLFFIVGSLSGFRKLGGKLNVGGIVAALIIAAGMLYASECFAVSLQMYNDTYHSTMTLMEVFRHVPQDLDDSAQNSFIGELFYGYLFLLIGGICYVRSYYRNSNFRFKMEKLN